MLCTLAHASGSKSKYWSLSAAPSVYPEPLRQPRLAEQILPNLPFRLVSFMTLRRKPVKFRYFLLKLILPE